jgi:hypothetical protein
MGQIYLHKCDYVNAVKYLKRGIKGRLKSSHLHTCLLEEKLRLAQAYIGQKKYEEAKTNLIEALKAKEYFIKQMQQNVFVYESYKYKWHKDCYPLRPLIKSLYIFLTDFKFSVISFDFVKLPKSSKKLVSL